jgi:hypothetical protein
VRIAATEERCEEDLDPWVKRRMAVEEALVPNPQDVVHGVFDDLFERVERAAGPVAPSLLWHSAARGGPQGGGGDPSRDAFRILVDLSVWEGSMPAPRRPR